MPARAEPRIVVEGRDRGRLVASVEAAHGVDPFAALHERGWVVDGVPTIHTIPEPWELHVAWPVRSIEDGEAFVPDFVERDPSITDAELDAARRRLRPAAYGLVASRRGILLTELSERTHAPGWWNLPGGGLDRGESPEAGLRREVLEETGQEVGEVRLHSVLLRRHISRGPAGVEDFQSVRIIHLCRVAEPTEPVVHDVGGSTSRAGWFAPDDLGDLPIAPSLRPFVEEFVAETWS